MKFARIMRFAFSLQVFLLLFSLVSVSQQATISGRVTDASDHTPLIGVNILVDSLGGGTTDKEGYYKVSVNPGKHIITFRFIGYQEERVAVEILDNTDIVRHISLKPLIVELNTAVISASKYEQRLSDVTVSMEVIKPEFIENQNIPAAGRCAAPDTGCGCDGRTGQYPRGQRILIRRRKPGDAADG